MKHVITKLALMVSVSFAIGQLCAEAATGSGPVLSLKFQEGLDSKQPVDDPTGTLVYDYSGNMLHGVLTNYSDWGSTELPGWTSGVGNNLYALSFDDVGESTASLLPAIWSPVTTPPVVVGDQVTVTVGVSGSATFYQLKK